MSTIALVPLFLSACSVARAPLPQADVLIPPAPAALGQKCFRTPIRTLGDGSLTAALAEEALRARDIDLAECDDRRRLGFEAWPKAD